MSSASSPKRTVPVAYHVLAASLVTFCCWMALQRPEAYRDAMQEDRAVEWMTVFVFAGAGIVTLARALRARRPFDILVGAFLLFVAGEEMSWGQRLLGLTPPAYFLEHNTQQEMNVHNFADLFGSPKGPFIAVLVGYAVILPLASRLRMTRALVERLGATAPPVAVLPWFLLSIVLLAWYPFRFTGEWTELLAGSAFFASSGAAARTLAAMVPTGLAFALAMQALSGRGQRSGELVRCAAREVTLLADALRAEFATSGDSHRRVWSFIDDGRLDSGVVRRALVGAQCSDGNATRLSYAVDPWGTAYWVRVTRGEQGPSVLVYSFGPNRRRDGAGADDVSSAARPR